VTNAELSGTEPLPTDEREEVVLEAAHVRSWLAEPKRGLDHRRDAGRRHRGVVVGGSRRHVHVRIEELHVSPWPAISRAKSAGTSRPADRRSAL
jgi:hypothetical protein